jgi:uroporphyrinogen-III decarboxylase
LASGLQRPLADTTRHGRVRARPLLSAHTSATPALASKLLGAAAMFTVPNDAEKEAVWEAYQARRPTRVPLRWNTNVRIILLDPELNPDGYSFEAYCNDPYIMMTVQARLQEYRATTFSQTSDCPAALPAHWSFGLDFQNTYDGAYFGAPVHYADGQCPSNTAALAIDDVDDFLARDFSRPLENPWIREQQKKHQQLVAAAESFSHLGRTGTVAPFGVSFDGPVTVAAVIFGDAIFMLMAAEPAKAARVLETIVRACIVRNRAVNPQADKPEFGFTADDSIQLISTKTYREIVAPAHELWYSEMSATTPTDGKRGIHLCGDSTRHFKTLRDQLGVTTFDTGFPVDHGALRRDLGPEIEISGGPEVDLLRDGSAAACAEKTRAILESGVMEGGRFILQEGNNLPPCCPQENLRAVYETCLEYGQYG